MKGGSRTQLPAVAFEPKDDNGVVAPFVELIDVDAEVGVLHAALADPLLAGVTQIGGRTFVTFRAAPDEQFKKRVAAVALAHKKVKP